MLNLHLSFDVHKQLLLVFPKSDVKWLPDTVQFPQELIPSNSNLKEKETLKNLLLSNDFPVMEKEQPRPDACIGEIIERPAPQQNSPKTKAVIVSKKHLSKLNNTLSKLKNIEDVKVFIKNETDQRQKCRKEALTKKLEQTEWKALKVHMKFQLTQNMSLAQIRLTLYCWIICPLHKGTKCPEVDQIESKFK